MATAPTPFVWGRGGRRMTPEEIAREREIADKLGMQAGDTSPVGHWTQGAARVVNALGGVLADRRANAAADLNKRDDMGLRAKVAAALSGGSIMSPSPPQPSANVASALLPSGGGMPAQTAMVEGQPPVPGLQQAPAGASAESIRAGLMQRGLPEHVADAFVVNFQDESGLDPGINERNPIVPGSRGGFGLYQLTGPRRVAYEQYAAERGLPLDSVDAQLDFLMLEGQGSEKAAFDKILAAPDKATAAQAIVNEFLRPAPEYRRQRAQRYASLGGGAQTGYVDPMVSAQPALPGPSASGGIMDAIAPPMSADYFPPAPSAPQAGGINPVIAEILMSDVASPQTMQMAQLLMDRDQQAQERAMQEQQRAEMLSQRQAIAQQYGIDPSLVPVDEAWNLALERSLKGGEPLPLMNLGDGTVYDPNLPEAQRFIRDPNRQQPVPDSIRALDLRAERAGLKPGTPEYNQFMLTEGKAAGMQLRVMPDGTFEFSESGGLKPLTEAQSKDNVFLTRAQNAMPLIDTYEQNLLSLGENAAGAIPLVGNYLQSEEYQLGRDAGREFLATLLRKDTGAAVTTSEEQMYGDMFLPRPGDKPRTVEAKRQRRKLAVEAIATGMSIQQIERVAKAIEAVEPSTAVVDKATDAGTPPAGIDPEDWKFMTPEERRLFQ